MGRNVRGPNVRGPNARDPCPVNRKFPFFQSPGIGISVTSQFGVPLHCVPLFKFMNFTFYPNARMYF